MSIELFDYQHGDQMLEAAVAFPVGNTMSPAPVVIVVHAWTGRGEHEHQVAEKLAMLGYIGVAIDVYGKGIVGNPAGDNSHLMAPWIANRAGLLARLQAGVAFAKSLPGGDASAIAAIGYCFGGLCVLDLARSGGKEIAGVVSLHGTYENNNLGSTDAISAKVLIEHGWLDPLSPTATLKPFAEEMALRNADWQLHAHGLAMHAFTHVRAGTPEYGIAYNADADRRSWISTTAFLSEVFIEAVAGRDRKPTSADPGLS